MQPACRLHTLIVSHSIGLHGLILGVTSSQKYDRISHALKRTFLKKYNRIYAENGRVFFCKLFINIYILYTLLNVCCVILNELRARAQKERERPP